MSVKVAYSRGFEKGLEEAAVKLAAAYGIEKTALIDDIKGMVGLGEEKPMFDSTDAALAGGGALAVGAGLGADALGRMQGNLADAIARNKMQGRHSLQIGKELTGLAQDMHLRDILKNHQSSLSGNRALQQAILDHNPALSSSVAASGRAPRARAVLDAMIKDPNLSKTDAGKLIGNIGNAGTQRNMFTDLTRAEGQHHTRVGKQQLGRAKEMQGSTSGKLNQMGFNAKNLGRAGTALKGLGALGGATLLGKKLYDVVTD